MHDACWVRKSKRAYLLQPQPATATSAAHRRWNKRTLVLPTPCAADINSTGGSKRNCKPLKGEWAHPACIMGCMRGGCHLAVHTRMPAHQSLPCCQAPHIMFASTACTGTSLHPAACRSPAATRHHAGQASDTPHMKHRLQASGRPTSVKRGSLRTSKSPRAPPTAVAAAAA